MKEEKEILEILENSRPILSASSRDMLWEKIRTQVESTPVVSPYYSMFVVSKKYIAVAMVLLLVVSGGGTAYAGNQARPGERLFVVDKALEQFELTLAPTTGLKKKVSTRHGEERLFELREIVALTENNENDMSQIKDSVSEILRFIDESRFDESTKGAFISKVAREIREDKRAEFGLGEVRLKGKDMRIEIKDDEDDEHEERRIEVRDGEKRIRIEEKNGEVRIKTSSHSDDMDEDDSRSDDSDDRDDDRRDVDDDLGHDDDDSDDRSSSDDSDINDGDDSQDNDNDRDDEDNSGSGSDDEDDREDSDDSSDDSEDRDDDRNDSNSGHGGGNDD